MTSRALQGSTTNPANPLPSHTNTDRVILSFCAAWICFITSTRNLLPPSAFRKIPFNNSTTPALRRPPPNTTDLRHRGLFAWLSTDAPRQLPGRRDAVVTLVVKENGTVVEIYEMKCIPAATSASAETIRADTKRVLKSTSTVIMSLRDLDGRVEVEVGVGEVGGEGLGRFALGAINMDDCEVRCSALVEEARQPC